MPSVCAMRARVLPISPTPSSSSVWPRRSSGAAAPRTGSQACRRWAAIQPGKPRESISRPAAALTPTGSALAPEDVVRHTPRASIWPNTGLSVPALNTCSQRSCSALWQAEKNWRENFGTMSSVKYAISMRLQASGSKRASLSAGSTTGSSFTPRASARASSAAPELRWNLCDSRIVSMPRFRTVRAPDQNRCTEVGQKKAIRENATPTAPNPAAVHTSAASPVMMEADASTIAICTAPEAIS